jgi:hypothetical protein
LWRPYAELFKVDTPSITIDRISLLIHSNAEKPKTFKHYRKGGKELNTRGLNRAPTIKEKGGHLSYFDKYYAGGIRPRPQPLKKDT